MVYENKDHRNENFMVFLDILSFLCFLDIEKKCDFKPEYVQVQYSYKHKHVFMINRKSMDGYAIKLF